MLDKSDVPYTGTPGSCDLTKCLPQILLLAGAALLGMYMVGATRGLGLIFGGAFCIHVLLLILATFGAILNIVKVLRGNGIVTWIAAGLLLVTLAVALAEARLPISAIDALVHHLAVPKWWIERGVIAPIDWHEWSYYPMLVNVGYAGLVAISRDRHSAYYHFLYWIVTSGLVAWLVQRLELSRIAKLGSVTVVALLPIMIKLAGDPLVDIGLAAFVLLGACFLQLAFDRTRDPDGESVALAVLGAGVALGLAAGTKLNGGLFTAILFVTLPFMAQWRQLRPSSYGLIVLGCLVTYSPWLVQNYIHIGNPVYPMLKGVFGGDSPVGASPGLPPLLHRHLLYGESWFDIVTLPIRLLAAGRDGDPRTFDGTASPLLLLAFLVPFFSPIRKKVGVVFPAALIYLLASLILSAARVRYVLPSLPFMVIGSVAMLDHLLDRYLVNRKSVLAMILLSIFGINSVVYGLNRLSGSASSYLTGEYNCKQFLATRIPEYPIVRYVNERLPNTAHIYLIGTSNPFYLYHVSVSSAGYFSTRDLLGWLNKGSKPGDILSQFKKRGVTHLVLHNARTQEAVGSVENPQGVQLWNDFSAKHLKPLVESGDYSLWELVS